MNVSTSELPYGELLYRRALVSALMMILHKQGEGHSDEYGVLWGQKELLKLAIDDYYTKAAKANELLQSTPKSP